MASKSYLNLFARVVSSGESKFLGSVSSTFVPHRTTFILKRRYPVPLVKKGEENFYRKLKAKTYIYDLVEDTDIKKQRNIKVTLTAYVEGMGEKGDVVEVKRNIAYHKLILPGLADYATEEDIKRAEEEIKNSDDKLFSTKTAPLVVKYLEKMVLGLVMNKETPWTLEPWHAKIAFRKAGVNVPEEAIKLPQEPISGPDISLENKEFIVKVTINEREVAHVRSRIHHWSTNIQDRLPYVVYPWCQPSEPLFKEDAAVLEKLSLPSIPAKSSKILSTP